MAISSLLFFGFSGKKFLLHEKSGLLKVEASLDISQLKKLNHQAGERYGCAIIQLNNASSEIITTPLEFTGVFQICKKLPGISKISRPECSGVPENSTICEKTRTFRVLQQSSAYDGTLWVFLEASRSLELFHL